VKDKMRSSGLHRTYDKVTDDPILHPDHETVIGILYRRKADGTYVIHNKEDDRLYLVSSEYASRYDSSVEQSTDEK